MELQKVIIHLARRRKFFITNVYLPAHCSDYSSSHQGDQSWLYHLPKEAGLVCGDFNAHHSSFYDYVYADPQGSALLNWMEAHSKAVLSDGSQTRGLTKVLESVHRISFWLIRLWLIASHGKPFQSLAQTTSCCFLCGIGTLWWSVTIPIDAPSTPKRIGLFHKYLDNGIHAVSSVRSMSKGLEAFVAS